MTRSTPKQTDDEREKADLISRNCACPKSHAHRYEGRCRWSVKVAAGKHLCPCVNAAAAKVGAA